MRRGDDAVDVEGLLLWNSEARRAHFRAAEDSRKAAGFIAGVCVLAVYSCAFVVAMLCTCNEQAACGCKPPSNAHSALSAPRNP